MLRPPRLLTGLVLATTLTSLAGCGTVFHPERKGQISGRIDPVVAVANGVGLLFFIVPGVIAYAVDFSNGTIYLPGTSTTSVDALPMGEARDLASLEQLISERAGTAVSLSNELVRVEQVATLDEALAMVRMASDEASHGAAPTSS
ncbi:hypothetical protein LCL99_17965 [Halomonas denitrificans]|uniref:hypothetical protein n=1 Tax=Halomonas TaxID=2745 RepID=UPI001A8C7436|nr:MULTISPECIES: hypothetical protein [Halomonas]MED5296876.1 hypothetical protein [Pseudomonadota bacterium]MBN8410909.1 hypothetical protein [Halomonas litopenaei]MBY5925504.1 hypothetical protein [Halomonas sp. DP4Y7-2]MBY5930486.1 hypothetical protein [Halomonas sp. DP8Y7-3]MBY6030771.1 hypothetical protein [Halomonas sp. DP8Y7-1]